MISNILHLSISMSTLHWAELPACEYFYMKFKQESDERKNPNQNIFTWFTFGLENPTFFLSDHSVVDFSLASHASVVMRIWTFWLNVSPRRSFCESNSFFVHFALRAPTDHYPARTKNLLIDVTNDRRKPNVAIMVFA